MSWEELFKEVLKLEGPLRRAFIEGMWHLRSAVDRARLVKLLQAGQIESAVALVFVDEPVWGAPLVEAMSKALKKSVHLSAARLDAQVGEATSRLFVSTGPRFEQEASDFIASQIKRINNESRDAVRAVVERSVNEGRNPRSVITDLAGSVHADGSRSGGIIGLTERQATAVMNFRKALEGRSMEALSRQLRDRRYDAAMRDNAVRTSDGKINPDHKPLSEEKINMLVRRYEGRMLAYRAEVIARTESLRIQGEAQLLSWNDAVNRGAVSIGQMTKTWFTARDEKVRPAHAAMHGVVVGLNDYFMAEDTGPILMPSAPNCRCMAWIQPDYRRKA